MPTEWGLTIDCARPRELAAFWALALGYVEAPPPSGYAGWEEWLRELGVPEEEWDDAAYLVDPAGAAPSLSLLRVPESKVVKNRVHVDLKVSGGRSQPADLRLGRMRAVVDRLVAAGAAVHWVDEHDGAVDHFVLTDPEGNEFCVV
jgi:hypothetical protein